MTKHSVRRTRNPERARKPTTKPSVNTGVIAGRLTRSSACVPKPSAGSGITRRRCSKHPPTCDIVQPCQLRRKQLLQPSNWHIMQQIGSVFLLAVPNGALSAKLSSVPQQPQQRPHFPHLVLL